MQVKRPLCIISVFFCLTLLLVNCFFNPSKKINSQSGTPIRVSGRVVKKEYKKQSTGKTLVVYLGDIPGQREQLLCYPKNGEAIPKIGQIIRVEGKLYTFDKASNEGEFDAHMYYEILHIAGKVKECGFFVEEASYDAYREGLFQIGTLLGDGISVLYEEDAAGVLRAMLLGDKSELLEETKTLYRMGGIIHVLAISGLHISLLGMGLYKLLRRLFLPDSISSFLAIFLMFSFGEMTGMGTSALRAIVMFTIALLAQLLGRTYDMGCALCLICDFILLEQPLYCRHSGFLLSFGAVAGLILVHPFLQTLLGDKEEVNNHVKNPLQRLMALMRSTFLAGGSVLLATLPILLYFYYSYPLYSLLFNIYVIPCMTFVMIFGLGSLFCSTFSFAIAKYFAFVPELILKLYDYSCRASTFLPGGIVVTGKPGWQQIFGYYFILGICLWWIIGKNRLYLPKAVVYLWLLTAILLVGRQTRNGLTCLFMDVGQGDGILVMNDTGKNYLFDGGSTSKDNVGTYQMMPCLLANGVGELEGIFVSHPDEDHISGVLEILEKGRELGITVKALILPKVDKRLADRFADIVAVADENRVPILYIHEGDTIRDGELQISCLSPTEGYYAEETNELSEVFLLSYEKTRILLTGDVTGNAEEMLQENENLGRVDVLKVAHHGSMYSTPASLLEKINPSFAVISAGAGNRYGHPHKETLTRLEAAGVDILQTDKSGCIICEVKRDGKYKIYGKLDN